MKELSEIDESRVDPTFARSWLLVAATATARFDDAQHSRADQVILDLEDAVDPERKGQARSDVLEWLAGGGRAWVRINDCTTTFWDQDVSTLRQAPGLIGIVLAKTESAEHVTETYQRFGESVPVIPLVESAIGIDRANEIACAAGAFRLAFGSGDYRRDTGTSNDALAMAYPRSRLVLASRIGGLPGPVDGPTVIATHSELREQTAQSVSLGMTGKLCLTTEQPAIINETISPSPADVRWAVDFLAEFNAAGRIIRDGSDKPRLALATTIQQRAQRFRIAAS